MASLASVPGRASPGGTVPGSTGSAAASPGAAASLSGTGSLGGAAGVTAPAFAPVGSGGSTTAHTFTLTPHAVSDSAGEHFILVGVISETIADFATSLSSSNVTWDPAPLVAHTAFSSNAVVETVFKGKVTSTSPATVTISFAAGNPVTRTAWQEFSSSLGYNSVRLDTSGTVDVASGGSFPSLTPGHGSGELYWGYLFDSGTGTAGSTSGVTYYIDPNGNPMAYDANVTGTLHPNIGDSTDGVSGIAVLLYQAITMFSGGASLSGSGTLAASAPVAKHEAVALSGSGTVTAAGTITVLPSAALIGEGFLAAAATLTAPGQGSAALSGSGSLSASAVISFAGAAALSGTGTLTPTFTGTIEESAALSGSGTLTVAAKVTFKLTTGLFGGGFLAIPQVAGGLVAGVGGAGTPMALPGSSQVAVAPPGSSNWQWLGTLGQVRALTYSFVCPGGCDKMTCTVMVPASYQSQLFYPGWQVKIVRGGHDVWHGRLDQPSYQAGQGWTLTAVGAGNRGADFTAFYSPNDVWPAGEPDEIVNRAISRGLPWVNAGLNSSPYASQFWLGQGVDPGAQTVTAFLNLICSRGGLVWYVNSQPGGVYNGDDLSVFPLPTVPNRLLVSTSPVPRTLGGYINTIFARYMSTADNTTTGTAASYNVVSTQNAASVAAHGVTEAYVDFSDVGVQTASQVQAICGNILSIYRAASFSGPFTVSYGQLLNMGGQAVDIGTDQAGSMAKLVLADSSYGGSVDASEPVVFTIGSYEYNDFTQTATIQPYQSVDESLSGLLSMENTTLKAISVASA